MTDEQLTEKAKEKVEHIFRKGMYNSAALAIFMISIVIEGYATGNYLTVFVGVLATYFSVVDAIDFYNFKKDLTVTAKVTNNGDDNGQA
jgi:hypothetical protein